MESLSANNDKALHRLSNFPHRIWSDEYWAGNGCTNPRV